MKNQIQLGVCVCVWEVIFFFADIVEKATWVTLRRQCGSELLMTLIWDRICTCLGFISHGPKHNSGHKVKQSSTINKDAEKYFKIPLNINWVPEAEKSSIQYWCTLNRIKTCRPNPNDSKGIFLCVWDEDSTVNRILWLKLHWNFPLSLKLA